MQGKAIGARIDRMTKNGEDPRCGRRTPFQVTHPFAAVEPKAKTQAVHRKIAEYGVHRAQFGEFLEDQPNHGPRLLVRILNHLSRRLLEVPNGHQRKVLAAFGLVTRAAQQAIAQRDQFEFAHGAFHSEEEPIVPFAGIVHAVLITQERVEDATDVDQLMPVFVGTRQSTQFQSQHHSDVIETDLGHQPLKPGAIVGGLSTEALILINHHDALR